jgi:hypothetical protein
MTYALRAMPTRPPRAIASDLYSLDSARTAVRADVRTYMED